MGHPLRDLSPGYFALVMATGIVSGGLRIEGWHAAAIVLLWIGCVAFGLLLAGTLWRVLRYRKEVLADEVNPSRSFEFFTFCAAADVLADRFGNQGDFSAATGFLIVGAASWLVLGYVLPAMLITRHGMRPALAGADGTWFLWVVGAQSIVVAITALPAPQAGWLEPVAVSGWCVGVVLYLAVAVLVLGRLFAFPVRASQLTPSYWVFMGATAISALAGARVLHWTSSPLISVISPLVAGFSVMLWAFGTWSIPMLMALSLWWEEARLPLVYSPGLWSIVFPVGMYGVASYALGTTLHVTWLRGLGSAEIWAGAVVWLLVAAGMAQYLGHRAVIALSSRSGDPPPRGG